MKKNILLLFLSIFFLFANTKPIFGETSQTIELNADAAILMDAKTGKILYEKNSTEHFFPASITKLMTALLALESGQLGETITFSHNAIYGIEPGSSHIALQAGEEITMEQALYALLLQSANEAALGIAEQVDSSVEAFAQHMTDRSKELGCTNTNFVNPNGLHDDNHYTTAYDMALIAKEVLKFEEFRKIIQTTSYEIPPTNKQPETRYLHGQHQMIKQDSIYFYEGCEGGKTGFTNEAQHTLVTYAKQGDTELIAVVLHATGTGHYEDTIKLFDYGFANYQTIRLFAEEELSTTLPVFDGTEQLGTVFVTPEKDIFQTVTNTFDKTKLNIKKEYPKQLQSPVKKGDTIATVTLSYENNILETIPIFAESTVDTAVTATVQKDTAIPKETTEKTPSSSQKDILLFVAVFILAFGLLLLLCSAVLLYRQKKRKLERLRKRQHRRYP